jgi:predicted dehydrogenase
MEQVRVGVIGTSWYTEIVHLPGVQSHAGAHLSAICGRNRDRAAELAAKHEIPLVFTDYREMIAKGDLDAVLVVTPDDLHYPIVMEALAAGLHVMCEKPLASNAAQARAMYEKAEAAGVKHMVVFTYPWMAHYRRLGQLVDEGYIGRPFHCSVSYLAGYGRDGSYQWRFDNTRANGALGNLGSHAIQFARLYMGEFARVSARLHAYVQRTDSEGRPIPSANDAAVLAVEFANGAQGTIQISEVAHYGARWQDQRVILNGEAGTLESEDSGSSSILRGARAGEEQFTDLASPPGTDDDTWPQAVGDRLFIDCIRENKRVAPTLYDGLKVQEVIDAALASNRIGCWVSVLDDTRES